MLLPTYLLLLVHCGLISALFDFPKISVNLTKRDRNYLNNISPSEWQQFMQSGIESVLKEQYLERNLLNSQITVQNGSVSHVQLLDSLPNEEAKKDSEVATKILRSSLYFYHSECVPRGIQGAQCAAYLESMPLPTDSDLYQECSSIVRSRREGHHAFRRLLPRHYKDSFYEMFSDEVSISPFLISGKAMQSDPASGRSNSIKSSNKNLAFVQWAQFIEHDLSKPVVTSMSNGQPIECCNRDSYKLQPRYRHPSCAPLYSRRSGSAFSPETCMNYVRSAFAVGAECTFGTLEQLNQATGYLDLSQLYGFTAMAETRMRLFEGGKIKYTPAPQVKHQLLSLATGNSEHEFCAWKLPTNNSICFMAGDSRVNSNPLAISIYTIFMRNHNAIANELQLLHPDWSDQSLYEKAKGVNAYIYRRVVFEEWLPEVIGSLIAESINTLHTSNRRNDADLRISNEFAVAAMRFYFSMLPNELESGNPSAAQEDNYIKTKRATRDSPISLLGDQAFRPNLTYSAMKLNTILQSALHQSALNMDATYADSLITQTSNNAKATHIDVLALDIQRGRDHGLQKYVKYLEICASVQIHGWKDLEQFMSVVDINKLKSVYPSWTDIDLIVGGISERPMNGSTVGPTFSCIIAEEFNQIRKLEHKITTVQQLEQSEMKKYRSMSAAHILCANSDIQNVTKNIFQLSSHENPLMSCAELLAAERE